MTAPDVSREVSPPADAETPDGLGALVRRAPGLVALIAFAVVGLGISIYLTTVHYAKVAPVCTTTSLINCQAVTSSKYSVVPGTDLPITVPGMLWFLVVGGLAGYALARIVRGQAEPPRLRLALLLWGALGLAFVLYLVYAEIVLLGQICEWCTVVHLLTLATFLVALRRYRVASDGPAYAARSIPEPRRGHPGQRGNVPRPHMATTRRAAARARNRR